MSKLSIGMVVATLCAPALGSVAIWYLDKIDVVNGTDQTAPAEADAGIATIRTADAETLEADKTAPFEAVPVTLSPAADTAGPQEPDSDGAVANVTPSTSREKPAPSAKTEDEASGDKATTTSRKVYDRSTVALCEDRYKIDVRKRGFHASGDVYLKRAEAGAVAFPLSTTWQSLNERCDIQLADVGRDPAFYALIETRPEGKE